MGCYLRVVGKGKRSKARRKSRIKNYPCVLCGRTVDSDERHRPTCPRAADGPTPVPPPPPLPKGQDPWP